MPTLTPSPVTGMAAVDPAAALDHFEKLLAFETDCWDVHAALAAGQQDFVLLDVRSPEAYRQGHVPGVVNLPHRRIVERTLSDFPEVALFVVYCSGPHCNGADRAAVQTVASRAQGEENAGRHSRLARGRVRNVRWGALKTKVEPGSDSVEAPVPLDIGNEPSSKRLWAAQFPLTLL